MALRARAAALPALRAKTFKDTDKGVPIEYFRWRRVIIDECHEPLCMGSDDADESAMSSKRSSCAVRELLGIAHPDPNPTPYVTCPFSKTLCAHHSFVAALLPCPRRSSRRYETGIKIRD